MLGAIMVVLGLSGVTPAVGASAYSASRVPNVSSTEGVHYSDIDCWSAGNCVAVGSSDVNGSSYSRQVVVQETAGVWGTPSSPSPANVPPGGRFDAVSCPAAGTCYAVGRYGSDSGTNGALIAKLSGGTWAAVAGTTISVTSTVLPDAAQAELVDVDCSSATSCAAVGTYEGNDPPVRGLLDRLSGTTWTPSAADPPLVHGSPVASTDLVAVSCTAASVCVGVGTSQDGNGYEAGVIERLKDSVWAATPAAEPVGGDGNRSTLTAVSCGPTGRCAAVGLYDIYDSSAMKVTTTGLIDSSAGGTGWAGAQAPIPTGTNTVTPLGVSCAGDVDDTCGVVGYTTGDLIDSHNEYPIVVTATSTATWSSTRVTLPSDALSTSFIQNADLSTITCVDSGHCIAGGSFYNNDPSGFGRNGLLTTISPTAGTAVSEDAPLPTDAYAPAGQDPSFSTSLCLDATHCALLGSYGDETDVRGSFVDASGVVAPPAQKPDAPAEPTAVAGNGQATISWSAPANHGSAITGYTVTSSPGAKTCTTTGTLTCTVTGLTDGTAYTFTVTATNAGGTSAASPASAAVTPVASPFATVPKPTVTGTLRVGHTLTAHPGTWSPTATFTYQWLRAGKAISGATKSTYALVGADHGAHLSVRVTGTHPGYVTTSATSAATTAVAAGTITNTKAPKIIGTATVGKTLNASPGRPVSPTATGGCATASRSPARRTRPTRSPRRPRGTRSASR